ncbi:hypothetical protein BOM23_15540 [Erwinia sp. OLMDLW33]|nr:hypothetical protein BOM23_15540 [Erwinia sp. OLMDLW33]
MKKSESRKMTVSLRVRCTEEDSSRIREKADASDMSVSEFLRRAALGRRIVTRTDSRMVTQLLQHGGLLKHLYTQMNECMTTELSHEFSATLSEIRNTLKAIQIDTVTAGHTGSKKS